jgi:hypothetical protein
VQLAQNQETPADLAKTMRSFTERMMKTQKEQIRVKKQLLKSYIEMQRQLQQRNTVTRMGAGMLGNPEDRGNPLMNLQGNPMTDPIPLEVGTRGRGPNKITLKLYLSFSILLLKFLTLPLIVPGCLRVVPTSSDFIWRK